MATSLTRTAFGGAITAAAAFTIWGSDLFPAQEDPKGDPDGWTMEEMRRWLEAVSRLLLCALPSSLASGRGPRLLETGLLTYTCREG